MRHGVPRDTGLSINRGVAPIGFVSAMKSPLSVCHDDNRQGAFLFLWCLKNQIFSDLNIVFGVATLSGAITSGIFIKWVMS